MAYEADNKDKNRPKIGSGKIFVAFIITALNELSLWLLMQETTRSGLSCGATTLRFAMRQRCCNTILSTSGDEVDFSEEIYL